MSVCVTIRTNKTIEPDEIFKTLAANGEKIVVTSNKYPSLKFGNYMTALRGIEVNQEEDGLEVRVCSFASVDDYRLFAKTIVVLHKLTGGKAYEDDDDECVVENPLETYNEEWIEEQREASFMIDKTISSKMGHHFQMNGLFASFSVGPQMFERFEIDLDGKYNKEDMDNLQGYLTNIQWLLADKKGTSTRLMIPSPSGERGLTISAIYLKNGKVDDFDYISEESLFAIFDMDDKDSAPVLIPFEETWKILPRDQFSALDEYQFLKIGRLTVDMVHEMMKSARHLQPDDLHYRPTYPGHGYDEAQKTVILMWNPAISSVKLEEHNETIKRMHTEYFNWSVWDYKNAKCGDRFFLVKVGKEGRTGIVMSGVFDSHPHELDDWSGRGRQTFYMDMKPNVILNPNTAPMLTTEELQKAIPTFDWTGGHSSRILSEEQAKALENLWSKFLEEHEEDVDGVNMNAINPHFL